MPWQAKDTISIRDEFINKAMSGDFTISVGVRPPSSNFARQFDDFYNFSF